MSYKKRKKKYAKDKECYVRGCDSTADGVDGKCFFHSEDEMSAAASFNEVLGTCLSPQKEVN